MNLPDRIQQRAARVGVLGLGYVGWPLFCEVTAAGYPVIGYDIDPDTAYRLRQQHASVTGDADKLAGSDIMLICVPTPIKRGYDTGEKVPDLSALAGACKLAASSIADGGLVIVESSTYPGCTRELLDGDGGRYMVAYSPERIDPGSDNEWTLRTTPKLVGGDSIRARDAAVAFYDTVIDTPVPVSSIEVAEFAKIYENTQRYVNIALADEAASLAHKLGLPVRDVFAAAATKPFGYVDYRPGVGAGGHCIPVDPHYLVHAANRGFLLNRRIITAAADAEDCRTWYISGRILALSPRPRRVLVLGEAYKPNVPDLRESRARALIDRLRRDVDVDVYDPVTGAVTGGEPTAERIGQYDTVIVAVAHDCIDYSLVGRHRRIVDLCGVFADLPGVIHL